MRGTAVGIAQLSLERALHVNGARSGSVRDRVDHTHARVGGVRARQSGVLRGLGPGPRSTGVQFVLDRRHRLHHTRPTGRRTDASS